MQTNKLHIEYKPVQLILPMDYLHIIDDCDPVVTFREVVGGLNLHHFIKTSQRGRQEYNSETMLQLILFGFMENKRSLRDLEKACRNDIRFIYLAQGIQPCFMAFQRFIDTKLSESIDDIFYAMNRFIIEKETIETNTIYVDGTKIEANAHKFSFVWKKAVLKHQANLYLKITKQLQEIKRRFDIDISPQDTYEANALDVLMLQFEKEIEREGISFVYGKGSRKHPYQRHYERLMEYKNKLIEYQQHLDICGERNSYSKTDHDATFMHGKEDYYSKTGIFKPYYNVQIGVSEEYILHYGVYPNPTDTKTWIPFFESYYRQYGFYPSTPVADAGYGSYDNYLYNLNHGMRLAMKYATFSKENENTFKKNRYSIKNMNRTHDTLISDDGHEYHYSHEYEDRRGVYPQIKQIYQHQSWQESYKEQKIPKTISRNVVLLQLQEAAQELLKSEEGIQLRIQRSIEVEGAFGEIKANCEYTRIQRRGKKGVQTELCLVFIGFNLRKYHNKKYRIRH